MANPNPSPETRFQPGNPGGGKTSEQKRIEYEAAEMSARLRHKILSVITEKVEQGASAEEYLSGDILRLFKDSEDRAHGSPRAATEITGRDGGPIETKDVSAADILRAKLDAIASRAASATPSE